VRAAPAERNGNEQNGMEIIPCRVKRAGNVCVVSACTPMVAAEPLNMSRPNVSQVQLIESLKAPLSKLLHMINSPCNGCHVHGMLYRISEQTYIMTKADTQKKGMI